MDPGRQGDVVTGMPDPGPMAMLYRKDILDKHGITPATWAEFADAAKKLHAADPNVFRRTRCSAMAAGQWSSGRWAEADQPRWRQAAININDKISDFAAYWQDLITVVSSRPSRGSTMSGTPASTRAAMPPGSLRAGVRCS
jgi:multiple sugar transport system substrate-binding protein